VDHHQIHTEGIREVSKIDMQFAQQLGYTIKLLGIVKQVAAKKPGVQVSVYPALIPSTHVLANVNQVFNAVFVRGDVVGDTLFYGRGAGKDATASAVLSDVADAALDLKNGTKSRVQPFVAHAKNGRVVPLDEFFVGVGKSVLAPDEVLREILVPRQDASMRASYVKLEHREAMDIAIVSVGVWVKLEQQAVGSKQQAARCEDVRIVLGAVAPTPMRAKRAEEILRGKELTEERIREAARVAVTESQPIAIRNVLDYLIGVLEVPATVGGTFDIGGPEVVSYRRLMDLYAEEAGLRKRWIIPVPVLTPRLSSYWIDLVTPAPASLARPLAEGLSSRLVCGDDRIRRLVPVELLDCRSAIRAAIPSRRPPSSETGGAEGNDWQDEAKILPGDPEWAGKAPA